MPKFPYKGPKGDKWEIYKDAAKEWRWRRFDSKNNEQVGAAHEGYKNKADCIKNARRAGMKRAPK